VPLDRPTPESLERLPDRLFGLVAKYTTVGGRNEVTDSDEDATGERLEWMQKLAVKSEEKSLAPSREAMLLITKEADVKQMLALTRKEAFLTALRIAFQPDRTKAKHYFLVQTVFQFAFALLGGIWCMYNVVPRVTYSVYWLVIFPLLLWLAKASATAVADLYDNRVKRKSGQQN
jgi:hypothetical protein